MIDIGYTVQARASAVLPYGVWFEHGSDKILVLLPELTWQRVRDPKEVVNEGDLCSIRVLFYNDRDQAYSGSIKALHPEESPYWHLAKLAAGSLVRGRIVTVFPDEYTIELDNGAWGKMHRDAGAPPLQMGQTLQFRIAQVEPEESVLVLSLLVPDFPGPLKMPSDAAMSAASIANPVK